MLAEEDADGVVAVPDDAAEDAAGDTRWATTLARVARGVVVIKSVATRAFDTEVAGSAYATGFVIDAARGLILTNRHVAKPGPCLCEATFLNREEVALRHVYVDSIHDYAILRYSPSSVAFQEVAELELAPEAARPGLEVRVVGNDSGEKLAILSATIARVDRDAPVYHTHGYNDFNTSYIQAASGTKGGSSGSPVVDILGRVVALNAGSKTKSASAFYLPLHRVARALAIVRRAVPPGLPEAAALDAAPVVPRGCFAATYLLKGFDELRRLGLRRETEAQARASGASLTGLLVVDSVLPGGPAAAAGLCPGDLLLALEGSPVTDLLGLEAVLDEHVGAPLEVTVQRAGEDVRLRIAPADLCSPAVTPRRFLELWDGVFHELSYQQARNAHMPLNEGVYVAVPGYVLGSAGVPRSAIVQAVAGKEVQTLAQLSAAVSGLAPGARVPLRYTTFAAQHRSATVLLHIFSQWFPPPSYYQRCDRSGAWPQHAAGVDGAAEAPVPVGVHASVAAVAAATAAAVAPKAFADAQEEDDAMEEEAVPPSPAEAAEAPSRKRPRPAPASPPPEQPRPSFFRGLLSFRRRGSALPAPPAPPPAPVDEAAAIGPSLALLTVTVPPCALADGVICAARVHLGVVLHLGATHGLLVADRNAVPIASADVQLSFAAHPAEAVARIVFLHPVRNYALLSFELAQLAPEAREALRAARLDAAPLAAGEEVRLVGLSPTLRVLQRASRVTESVACFVPVVPDVPRFRATNQEVYQLDDDLGSSITGVLCRRGGGGAVAAFYASFAKRVAKDDERHFLGGLPSACLAAEVSAAAARLEKPIASPPPPVWLLDVELGVMPLSKAQQHGLSDAWVRALLRRDPGRRQALKAIGAAAGSPVKLLLPEGDLLLSLDGAVVASFADVDEAVAAHVGAHDRPPPPMRAVAWRAGAEVELRLPLTAAAATGTERVVVWAGAQVQATHRAVAELGYLPPEGGCYVSRWHHGSPAHRHGLFAAVWLTSVNGVLTPTLDALLVAVRGVGDRQPARLCITSLHGRRKVLTLKADLMYWPTFELIRGQDGEWRRVDHAHDGPAADGAT